MSMVTVEHLHKVFGRFTAVKDATFSIEKGEIVGNKGNALAIAKKWLNQFKKKGNMPYKEGFVEKSVSHAFFLYEVAVYICYLLGEDISYEFLGEQKEKF